MADAMMAREAAEQEYTIAAALSFGWTSMELLVHLCDDYKLLRQWRWGHLVYFACRYTGLLTTISFLVLACVGSKPNADTLCQGFYVFEHITSSLLFLSTGAMFWLRAGFICQWKRRLMIPLALYGLTISALAMRSDVADIRRTEFLGDSTEEPSLVCAISSSTKVEQAILRFLMASFDVLTAVITFTYLYKKKAPQSWLKALLTRDQLIYVGATTLVYISLGVNLLIDVSSRLNFLGVLCPSIISIVSCRLFVRLKKKGSEGHHVGTISFNMEEQPTSSSYFSSHSKSKPQRSKSHCDGDPSPSKTSAWSGARKSGNDLQQPATASLRPDPSITSQISLLHMFKDGALPPVLPLTAPPQITHQNKGALPSS